MKKDRFAKITFERNFPHIRYLCKPVEELTVRGDALEPVDVFTAGFPCQPFSVAGEKKGFEDKTRGELFLHIIRILREFGTQKPKILLLENVRNFRTHDRGRPSSAFSGSCNARAIGSRIATHKFSTR